MKLHQFLFGYVDAPRIPIAAPVAVPRGIPKRISQRILLPYVMASWAVAFAWPAGGTAQPPAPPTTKPAAPPPGVIVIRPQLPYVPEPDKPGHVRVRPAGASPAPMAPSAGTMPNPSLNPSLTGQANQPRLVGNPANPGSNPLPATPPGVPNPAATADPEAGKLVHESWDVMFVQGHKVGYFHTVVREYQRDGQTYLYGVKTQKLQYARFGQPVEVWGEDSTLETPAGDVLTTRMKQRLGKDLQQTLVGKVQDGRLAVQLEGVSRGQESIPFPPGVLGVAGEVRLMKEKQPKPGDQFEYRWYEGRFNAVVRYQVSAIGLESLTIYQNRPPVSALKLEIKMVPIQGIDLSFQSWIDATTYEPLKVEADMPILGGRATILRTTKEFAQLPPAKLLEINESQSLPLPEPLPNIHSHRAITYEFRFPGPKLPEAPFRTDERQSYEVPPGEAETSLTRRLVVRPKRQPQGQAPVGNPAAEYLSDSYFIDWNQDRVKALSRQALDGLAANATAWAKAQAIERWVHRNMKPVEYSQALATCSATAESRTGDCTEYAMLAVGLCRAAGIPARTALGLVYAPTRNGRASLAFHMWFEVFVEGEWLALDGTLGQGSVGPGHLKIADASWAAETSLAPMLPVQNLLKSKPVVRIIQATP